MSQLPLIAMENTLFSNPALDWNARCETIAAAGFDGVYAVPYPLTDAELLRLETLGDAPKRHGLTLSAVYTNLDLAQAPDSEEGRRLTALFERTQGAPRIEISVKCSVPSALPAPEDLDDVILARLTPLLAIAERRGVNVALYPHSFYPLQAPAHAARLVARAAHPRLSYLFAVSHVYAVSDTASVLEQLSASAGEISSFNLCGCRRTGALPSKCAHFPLDEGDLDLAQILATLHAADYRGEVIVQGHGWTGDLPAMLRRCVTSFKQVTPSL